MTTLNELPHTFIETFLRHVTMIKFIGIDIFDQTENSIMKKYAKSVIILVCTAFMLLGQILYVVKKDEIGAQFLEVVSSIPIILGVGQAVVKMLVLMIKRNEIREVIMKIGRIWPTEIVNDDKMVTMRFLTQRLNFFGNVLPFSVLLKAAVVTLILFELLPLAITIYDMNTKTNAQYQFTIKMYFFHYLDSHYLYAIAYIFEAVTCTMAYLCGYIASELLLVALILDISALLIFLKIDLENIIHSSELQTIDEEDNCDDIKDIIILHQELLSIADDVNRIFGMIIFTQVSFTSVVICCYGFMALMANGLFLNYITASLGVMFEIFILSYPGQMLADTSSDIGNAAYNCHWYERGINFRKYILVIITRSQKPCLMSALGFSDLTQKMFSKVMSSSWSYLSLLNQMYSDL